MLRKEKIGKRKEDIRERMEAIETGEEFRELLAERGRETLERLLPLIGALFSPGTAFAGAETLARKAMERKKEDIRERTKELFERTKERATQTKERWEGRIFGAFERLKNRGEEIKEGVSSRIEELGKRAVELGMTKTAEAHEFVGRGFYGALAPLLELKAEVKGIQERGWESFAGWVTRQHERANDNAERARKSAEEARKKAENYESSIWAIEGLSTI